VVHLLKCSSEDKLLHGLTRSVIVTNISEVPP
jgi:hypothetical protein